MNYPTELPQHENTSNFNLPPNTVDLETFRLIVPNIADDTESSDDDNNFNGNIRKRKKMLLNSYSSIRKKRSLKKRLSQNDNYSPPKSSQKYPCSSSGIAGANTMREFDERFKRTKEYSDLMLTLLRLCEQKEQALADLRKLEIEYQRSKNNPRSFLNAIVAKCDFIPRRQVIDEIPKIDFKLYESLPSAGGGDIPKPGDLIRGKKYSSSKPTSFNRPWTFEEQKRLEELLNEYPNERVSSYRWERIARALGDRTPKQVSSRVQKYFLRLAQKGIPVPGKLPNLQNYKKEKNLLTVVPKGSRTPHV